MATQEQQTVAFVLYPELTWSARCRSLPASKGSATTAPRWWRPNGSSPCPPTDR
jgi:hypothetical protein